MTNLRGYSTWIRTERVTKTEQVARIMRGNYDTTRGGVFVVSQGERMYNALIPLCVCSIFVLYGVYMVACSVTGAARAVQRKWWIEKRLTILLYLCLWPNASPERTGIT